MYRFAADGTLELELSRTHIENPSSGVSEYPRALRTNSTGDLVYTLRADASEWLVRTDEAFEEQWRLDIGSEEGLALDRDDNIYTYRPVVLSDVPRVRGVRVRARSPEGELLWDHQELEIQTNSELFPTLVVGEQVYVYVIYNFDQDPGYLFALERDDGALAWVHELSEGAQTAPLLYSFAPSPCGGVWLGGEAGPLDGRFPALWTAESDGELTMVPLEGSPLPNWSYAGGFVHVSVSNLGEVVAVGALESELDELFFSAWVSSY